MGIEILIISMFYNEKGIISLYFSYCHKYKNCKVWLIKKFLFFSGGQADDLPDIVEDLGNNDEAVINFDDFDHQQGLQEVQNLINEHYLPN